MHINSSLNKSFVEMFNACVIGLGNPVDPKTLNEKAMKVGYIVAADACNTDVLAFINSQEININSTFYKEWEDVISKTRFELFIDQILHYMTTYGTDFSLGNGYVPNDGEGLPEFDYTKFKVITAITPKEMMERCYKLLCSGIALKADTLNAVCNYIYEFCYENHTEIDIDLIANREARIILYDLFKVAPKDKFELIKYMFYKATGSAMIIKNALNLGNAKAGASKFDMRILTDKQLEALASIFYRYKDVILMFKAYSPNRPIINKLRRMAVKYHQPMKIGFWESIMQARPSLEEIEAKVGELTNYKLVTLINMFYEKWNMDEKSKDMVVVRNGKVFFKDTPVTEKDGKYCYDVMQLLTKTLVNNMRAKSMKTVVTEQVDPETGETVKVETKVPVTVKIREGVHIACPTSEKNFVGNLPFGSWARMGTDNIIGIYWRNEWGTRDFDLSMNDVNGNRIGWNAGYYNNDNSLVYSGDMTNAQPEATELLWAKRNAPNGIVFVNRFSGNPGSKFKMFFANEPINPRDCRNHMVDPTNIMLSSMCESGESTQQMVGVVVDGKYVFADFGCGYQRVAGSYKANGVTANDAYTIFRRKLSSMIYANDILKAAGFNIVRDGECDVDLENPVKDTMISLFDKNE